MSKTKTFICAVPFQPKGVTPDRDGLQAAIYSSKNNAALAYGETRFPIIPVINAYASNEDNIRIIAIKTDGENYEYNYNTYFKPEVEKIVKDKNLKLDEIEIIKSEESEDIETHLKLFFDLISSLNDNEEIFACITYGTKPTPIIEFIALDYAYKLKKDISIGCIVYGRYAHRFPNDINNGIYDLTSFFHLNSALRYLADMKVNDPESAIKALFGFGSEEDKDERND